MLHHVELYPQLYLYIVEPFLMYVMSKTINIEEKLYAEMQKDAELHHETLKEHIEHTLWHCKKKQELLERIFDGLEIEKNMNTKIILKNLEERKFYDIDVSENGSKLYCKQCKSANCKHTSFVWTQLGDLDIHLALSK